LASSPKKQREFPPTERPLPVSWLILVGCVGWSAFQLYWWFTPGRDRAPSFELHGPLVREGDWWRVLLTCFEHANPLHLALNLSAVWTIGRVLEFGIGSFRFAVTSMVGAFGSAAFILFFDWDRHTVGVSGVILAWAGAMLPIATSYGRQALGLWLAQVVVISVFPGISWAGHLGGFLFGLPCGWVMRGPPERFGLAAPVLLLLSGVLVWLAGSGRI
jgi:rhomboid protease GluP